MNDVLAAIARFPFVRSLFLQSECREPLVDIHVFIKMMQ